MSTAPGHPSLRARIAEAIQSHLNNNAHRALGRELGVAGTTVSARGCDLHAWPADDLLALALRDECIAGAVVAYVRPEQDAGPRGDAVAVHSDLMRALADSAQVDAKILDSIRDGRVTRDELALIKSEMIRRRQHDDQLLADIESVIGGVR